MRGKVEDISFWYICNSVEQTLISASKTNGKIALEMVVFS